MKHALPLFALLSLQVLVACSDKPAPPAAAAPAASAAPQAPVVINTVVDKDVPASIKGWSFALGGKCAIDMINGPGQAEIASIDRAAGLAVQGWAFDEASGTVPAALVLQLVNGEERYYAPLERRGNRDDLPKAFGNAAYSEAGYAATINIAGLPAAQYEILVIQKGQDKNLVCNTFRKLIVKG